MNRQGKQSSNSKIEQRSKAIDRLKAASAKFTYIIENELWDQAGNVAESTSNLNIVDPMHLPKWRASCDKEKKWFEATGSLQGESTTCNFSRSDRLILVCVHT